MSNNLPDSSKKLLKYVVEMIELDESQEEIKSLAYLILEHFFKLNKAEIILDRSLNISSEKHKQLIKFVKRLNKNEPVQYILGEADFYGRKFIVNPHVLIPRQETEELVSLVVKENPSKKIRFLDIGTGTGCIPITILKELPGTKGFAIDFDPRVIKTARQNAERHKVQLEFMLIDILNEPIPLPPLDVIISNPPYITKSEESLLKPNVLEYEPSYALFVEDNDPLIYYRRIAELAKTSLKEKGVLYFEINERFGDDIKTMLEVMDYHKIEVIRDIHGKDRIVRASNGGFEE